jgi:dTDP-4-amino-4,6-dideoxygalactose transaminase
MTNVQAAIGVAQLEELPEFIKRKNVNYHYYKQKLDRNDMEMRLLSFRSGTSSNQWFYAVELPIEKMDCDLKTVIEELQNQREVQTRPIWGLIHEQRPYRNALIYRIEKADYYSQRIINIPCSTQLTMQEMELVVEAIRDIIRKHIH